MPSSSDSNFFFSSRRRHTISKRDWSSDVCSSDLFLEAQARDLTHHLDDLDFLGPEVIEDDGELGLLRSEEHTSELQSRFDLVCRLLLEKKKNTDTHATHTAETKVNTV